MPLAARHDEGLLELEERRRPPAPMPQPCRRRPCLSAVRRTVMSCASLVLVLLFELLEADAALRAELEVKPSVLISFVYLIPLRLRSETKQSQ